MNAPKAWYTLFRRSRASTKDSRWARSIEVQAFNKIAAGRRRETDLVPNLCWVFLRPSHPTSHDRTRRGCIEREPVGKGQRAERRQRKPTGCAPATRGRRCLRREGVFGVHECGLTRHAREPSAYDVCRTCCALLRNTVGLMAEPRAHAAAYGLLWPAHMP
jgi:hypothetical protein